MQLAPCPACGADRPLGVLKCPACGASWRPVPADAQKRPVARPTPQNDESPQPPRSSGLSEPVRARVSGAAAAKIWGRTILWLAAGWVAMDVLTHLLHLG